MNRGPKPKPFELRVIEGTAGADQDPGLPTIGVLTLPKWLKGAARKIWEEHAPLLPWLVRVDSETLATWCVLASEFHRDPHGMLAARISQMRTLAAELGMTPSGRTRIGNSQTSGKKDKDSYFT
jgi:phage terminase small subunit